jgi:hypothetical protein
LADSNGLCFLHGPPNLVNVCRAFVANSWIGEKHATGLHEIELQAVPREKYTITVWTGRMAEAGTAGRVSLELFGESPDRGTTYSGIVVLDQSLTNQIPFDMHQRDVFERLVEYLDDIKKIRVHLEPVGEDEHDEWYHQDSRAFLSQTMAFPIPSSSGTWRKSTSDKVDALGSSLPIAGSMQIALVSYMWYPRRPHTRSQ